MADLDRAHMAIGAEAAWRIAKYADEIAQHVRTSQLDAEAAVAELATLVMGLARVVGRLAEDSSKTPNEMVPHAPR